MTHPLQEQPIPTPTVIASWREAVKYLADHFNVQDVNEAERVDRALTLVDRLESIVEYARRSSRGETAPSDIAFNAAREGYLRGLDSTRRDDGFEMAMASAEAFAREYCDARWPAAGETAQESTAVDAKERETVERALAFVADFHGDARCALNCHHSEALAREVQRLRRQLRSPISPTRDTLRLDYLAANYTSVSDGYLASGVVAPLMDGTHGSVVLTGGVLGYVPRESPDWFRAAIDAAMGHSLPETPAPLPCQCGHAKHEHRADGCATTGHISFCPCTEYRPATQETTND